MAETIGRKKEGKISEDLLLLAGVLTVGFLLAGGYLLRYGGGGPAILGAGQTESGAAGGKVVQVSVNGTVVRQYPLNGVADEMISGVGGGSNHLHIEQGMAWVDEASCPDQICVHTGKITEEGQAIICLPNRVVVEIISDL